MLEKLIWIQVTTKKKLINMLEHEAIQHTIEKKHKFCDSGLYNKYK
jgi:hypothetical protein